MMITFVAVALEVLFQMMTGLGIIIYLYRRNNLRRIKKCILFTLLLFIYCLEVYNSMVTILSISSTWLFLLLESIWLYGYGTTHFRKIFYCCLFYKWLFVIVKMPILIISGFMRCGTIIEIIRLQNLMTALIGMIISGCIWGLYRHNHIQINNCIKDILDLYGWSVFIIGVVEYMAALYMLYILRLGFLFSNLAMTVFFVLFLLMIFLCVYTQYKRINAQKQGLLSRDHILRNNYRLLKQEQENSIKVMHDYRHGLDYLRLCFINKDFENGVTYIEKQTQKYRDTGQGACWTKNTSIDFLINRMKKNTEDCGIHFEVEADIIALPIAECDFFIILDNLLENAWEATVQCDANSRFISLRIYEINEMVMLYLENSYVIKPIMKHGRFITTKTDGNKHGWGIENVKELVEHNFGTISIQYTDSIFSTQIMFGIKDESSLGK